MTDPTDGGTVRYHRAEYLGDVSFPWEVWFDGGQGPIFFTAEQGEAMGLTPSEPAPLVVTCNGHRVELSDEEAAEFIRTWLKGGALDTPYDRSGSSLARLLRDARQDLQPASDEPPDDDLAHWAWTIIANAGVHQSGWDHMHPEWVEAAEKWRDAFHASLRQDPQPASTVEIGGQVMTQAQYDAARFPLLHSDPQPASDPADDDPNGLITALEEAAARQSAVEPDTSDTLDFDAMPIGTVIRDKWGDLLLRRAGGWFEGDEDYFLNADDGPYTVVHQPAPLSPGECLRGLLAGRDDADELIAHPYRHQVSWLSIIGDAAHGGA